MLLAIPERGSFRGYDPGNLGFPWLMIADVVVAGAQQGWSYWRTKQQIEQAKRVSGTEFATQKDYDAMIKRIETLSGRQIKKEELRKYIQTLVEGSPSTTQELPPNAVIGTGAGLPPSQKASVGIPTWGWIAIAALGFVAVKQFGVI